MCSSNLHTRQQHPNNCISIPYASTAGGSSPTVSLWDLRMTDPSSNKVVQNYCPRNLEGASTVSVSGIDVSRDGQELLLSYESDQIYTFPVFPSSCSANPTADEIENLVKGTPKVLPELACYGAHLNRFTFLKVSTVWTSA